MSATSSTAARSGCTATRPASRRSTRTSCSPRRSTSTPRRSWPGEMYCRSYARDVRPRADDPALRHPARAACARGHGGREVRRARALAGEPISINGDGNQARQFVYVEDLADGIVAALCDAARGRTYNLVGDETVSVREIATIVQDAGRRGRRSCTWPGRQADLAQRAHLARAGVTPSSAGVRPRVSPTESRATSSRLAGTNGSPSAATRSMINGSAATVLRQESGAL